LFHGGSRALSAPLHARHSLIFSALRKTCRCTARTLCIVAAELLLERPFPRLRRTLRASLVEFCFLIWSGAGHPDHVSRFSAQASASANASTMVTVDGMPTCNSFSGLVCIDSRAALTLTRLDIQSRLANPVGREARFANTHPRYFTPISFVPASRLMLCGTVSSFGSWRRVAIEGITSTSVAGVRIWTLFQSSQIQEAGEFCSA
jgi:hypothetical protein